MSSADNYDIHYSHYRRPDIDEAISRPPRLPRLGCRTSLATLAHHNDTKKSQLYGQSAGEDINSHYGLSAKPGIANADYTSYRHNQIAG